MSPRREAGAVIKVYPENSMKNRPIKSPKGQVIEPTKVKTISADEEKITNKLHDQREKFQEEEKEVKGNYELYEREGDQN